MIRPEYAEEMLRYQGCPSTVASLLGSFWGAQQSDGVVHPVPVWAGSCQAFRPLRLPDSMIRFSSSLSMIDPLPVILLRLVPWFRIFGRVKVGSLDSGSMLARPSFITGLRVAVLCLGALTVLLLRPLSLLP